uniref:Ankyrin repeat domain 63 n=1 Tax=Electrophorus electricus TaxID=8005 RepID=A0AAY5E8G6_ELEEL
MLRPKDLCQGSGTKTFLDAMNSGKVHLARFVLDALDGRIVNARAEGGRTPLMHAACLQDQTARAKFAHLLLERGANVNMQDEHGRTALSLACELGHLDAVKTLVQFNADPELTDSWGNSALMYAAYGGHSQVLEFLIRAFKRLGLKLEHTNHAGHSATQVAKYLGHTQCVQVLSTTVRKGVCSVEQVEEMGREGHGEAARPNRLPQQILERFSKQSHSKNEEALPVLFQRTPRELMNGVRPLASVRNDSTKTQNDDDAKGKRESLKSGSTVKNGRQNKLLFTREEIAPERIKVRPPGFGGLRTRLLRRFTAPEFMRLVRDCPSGPGLSKGKIARSETFPLSHTHNIVHSQPSVDSISGVRCEFEGSPPVTRA